MSAPAARRRRRWRRRAPSAVIAVLAVALALLVVLGTTGQALATGDGDATAQGGLYVRWPPPSPPNVRLGAIVGGITAASMSVGSAAVPTFMAGAASLLVLRSLNVDFGMKLPGWFHMPSPSLPNWSPQGQAPAPKAPQTKAPPSGGGGDTAPPRTPPGRPSTHGGSTHGGYVGQWSFILACTFLVGATLGMSSGSKVVMSIRKFLGLDKESPREAALRLRNNMHSPGTSAARENAAREAELTCKLDRVVMEKQTLVQEWGHKERGLQVEMRRLAQDSKAKGERIGVLEAQEHSLRAELRNANAASIEIRRLRAELTEKAQRASALQEQLGKATAAVAAAQSQLPQPQMLLRRLREIEERGNIAIQIRTGELSFVKELSFVHKRVGADAPSAEFADAREAEKVLRDVADAAMVLRVPVVVEGHSVQGGHVQQPEWLTELAKNRVQLVAASLTKQGISADRITAKVVPAGHPDAVGRSTVVVRLLVPDKPGPGQSAGMEGIGAAAPQPSMSVPCIVVSPPMQTMPMQIPRQLSPHPACANGARSAPAPPPSHNVVASPSVDGSGTAPVANSVGTSLTAPVSPPPQQVPQQQVKYLVPQQAPRFDSRGRQMHSPGQVMTVAHSPSRQMSPPRGFVAVHTSPPVRPHVVHHQPGPPQQQAVEESSVEGSMASSAAS